MTLVRGKLLVWGYPCFTAASCKPRILPEPDRSDYRPGDGQQRRAHSRRGSEHQQSGHDRRRTICAHGRDR